MRLEIDVAGYDSAADALLTGNQRVAAAYNDLTSALASTGGMGGNDKSSEDFVANYDSGAREVTRAIADLATAFGTLSLVTESSGINHRDANQASVYRGNGPKGDGTSRSPDSVSPYTPPSALGSDGADVPAFWDLVVDHLQGWAWPSADTGALRNAGTAWRIAATKLDAIPSYTQSAESRLNGQCSPEIYKATTAFTEVGQSARDLAEECRSLASACEEYAEKVDTTKETVKGLLKDLAIELGATALIAGVGSFFTFGGAGAAGGAVALARAASYAKKIIAAFQGIKAVRAVITIARTVEKATDVRRVLRKYRSAKNIRNRRPPGKLHPKGKPNSYGYDKNGNVLKYANERPKHRKSSVMEVWRKAQDENGEVWVQTKNGDLVKIDWERGQSRKGKWDMGHLPDRPYHQLRDDYLSGKITQRQFLDEWHDPRNYRLEHVGRNRSGMDEAIPRPKERGR